MKHLEGKDVYLKPTGNNARRFHEKIHKARVVKMARVNVILQFDGFKVVNKFRMTSQRGRLHISNNYNGGYYVFESEQELQHFLTIAAYANAISHKYRYVRDYKKLDLETIRKVADLLGVEINQDAQ